MLGHLQSLIGWQQAVAKKRRITHDEVAVPGLLQSKFLKRDKLCVEAIAPGGILKVLGSFLHGGLVDVDGVDESLRALRQHQSYDAAAGAYVEHTLLLAGERQPRPQQHGVGAGFHGALVMVERKLPETKRFCYRFHQ